MVQFNKFAYFQLGTWSSVAVP